MGPQSAMARPVEAPMVCCQKMSAEKSCCKDKQEESTQKHSSKGGCKSCSCAFSVDVKPPLFASVEDNDTNVEFSEKKQKYFYLEIVHANDARTIWLPPKIS